MFCNIWPRISTGWCSWQVQYTQHTQTAVTGWQWACLNQCTVHSENNGPSSEGLYYYTLSLNLSVWSLYLIGCRVSRLSVSTKYILYWSSFLGFTDSASHSYPIYCLCLYHLPSHAPLCVLAHTHTHAPWRTQTLKECLFMKSYAKPWEIKLDRICHRQFCRSVYLSL